VDLAISLADRQLELPTHRFDVLLDNLDGDVA